MDDSDRNPARRFLWFVLKWFTPGPDEVVITRASFDDLLLGRPPDEDQDPFDDEDDGPGDGPDDPDSPPPASPGGIHENCEPNSLGLDIEIYGVEYVESQWVVVTRD